MKLISIKDSCNHDFLISSWNDWYLKKSQGKWYITCIDVGMSRVFYLHPNAKIENYSHHFNTIDEAMTSLHSLAKINNVKDGLGQPNIFVKLQTSFWRNDD